MRNPEYGIKSLNLPCMTAGSRALLGSLSGTLSAAALPPHPGRWRFQYAGMLRTAYGLEDLRQWCQPIPATFNIIVQKLATIYNEHFMFQGAHTANLLLSRWKSQKVSKYQKHPINSLTQTAMRFTVCSVRSISLEFVLVWICQSSLM